MARSKLVDALTERNSSARMSPKEKVADSGEVELHLAESGTFKRVDFRCPCDAIGRLDPIQRLDPQATTGKKQAVAARVGDGERKHPSKLLQHLKRIGVLLEEMDQELCV